MFSELGSAIDDSFESNFFPTSIAPSHAPTLSSNYNGPRSGHWSISSSLGSAIDDGCPTVWGALPGQGPSGSHAAPAKPIDAGLLKKLGRLAVEKALALEAEAQVQDVRKDDGASHASVRDTVKPEQSAPKGFYVPRARASEQKSVAAGPKQGADEAPPRKVEQDKPKKAREPSPRPPAKAPYTALLPDTNTPRTIRIKGKDGQEAFVQLYGLPRPSTALATRTPAAEPKEREVAEVSKQKTQPKAKAKVEVSRPAKDEAARVAAEALMSGALPAPEKKKAKKQASQKSPPKKKEATKQASQKPASPAQPTPPRESRSSGKDSGIGLGVFFESTPELPSAAPSTAVSAKSMRDAIRNISQNSKRSVTPSKRGVEVEGAGGGWGGKDVTPVRSSRSSTKESAVGWGGPTSEARSAYKGSTKGSAVGWGGPIDTASSAHTFPASKAVSARSLRDAVKNISQNSMVSVEPSKSGFEGVGDGCITAGTPWYHRGFAPGGGGWASPATLKRISDNSYQGGWGASVANGSRAEGSGWGPGLESDGGWKRASTKPKTPSPLHIQASSSTHDHPFNGHGSGFAENARKEPTVFAGKGWISPHPLSLAPTFIASSPQSRISLPFTALHGREMSYDEWKAVQDGQIEHKRFSRAESVVGTQVLAVAESIAGGGGRSGSVRASAAGSQAYQKVTVESEHSSRHSRVSQGQEARGSGISRASGRPESAAGGWDVLPAFGGFDGVPDVQGRDSADLAGEAYRQHLNRIVSDHTGRQQPAGSSGINLTMPWDTRSDRGDNRGNRREQHGWVRAQADTGSERDSSASNWQRRIDEAEKGFAGW